MQESLCDFAGPSIYLLFIRFSLKSNNGRVVSVTSLGIYHLALCVHPWVTRSEWDPYYYFWFWRTKSVTWVLLISRCRSHPLEEVCFGSQAKEKGSENQSCSTVPPCLSFFCCVLLTWQGLCMNPARFQPAHETQAELVTGPRDLHTHRRCRLIKVYDARSPSCEMPLSEETCLLSQNTV